MSIPSGSMIRSDTLTFPGGSEAPFPGGADLPRPFPGCSEGYSQALPRPFPGGSEAPLTPTAPKGAYGVIHPGKTASLEASRFAETRGPKPGEPGCRIDKRVLAEFEAQIRERTAA